MMRPDEIAVKVANIRLRVANGYRHCRTSQRQRDLQVLLTAIDQITDDKRRLQHLYDESGPGEFAA